MRSPPQRLSAAATVIAVLLPLAFLGLGVLRAWPFVDDVVAGMRLGDDWHTYKAMALSVLQDGLAMPIVSGAYEGIAHGFLYVYFLAGVFAVFGVNSTYAYVVQSLTLGLSVSLTYVAFRRTLSPLGGLLFLVALAIWAYIDVFRPTTFRLLSENLYFLLSSLLFICLLRSLVPAEQRARYPVLTGVLLGLVVLTRPTFFVAAVLLILLAWGAAVRRRSGTRQPALMSAGIAIGLSGAAIRDLAATGRVGLGLVANPGKWVRIWENPLPVFLTLLAKRVLFVFGFTQLMEPAFRPRPHWMLLWLVAAAYPILARRRGRRIEDWEWALALYVLAYLVPVVLAGAVANYGGRMVTTILPVVLVFAFRTIDTLLPPALSGLPVQPRR